MALTAHSEELTWTKQQAATLIVVVAMHIWLLWLSSTKHTSQPVTPMETILVLLPIESKATPSERKPKHTPAPTRQHISYTDEPPVPEDRTLHLPAAEVPHAEVANQVDWYAAASARQAAKTAVTPSTVREFGHSIRQQAPTAIEPPGLFTQPVHRFGDITKTPDGVVVWLSANCYQVANSDADHFKAFATGMPGTDKNTVTCRKSFGQSQGNAQMFDFLKHPSASEHPEQVGP